MKMPRNRVYIAKQGSNRSGSINAQAGDLDEWVDIIVRVLEVHPTMITLVTDIEAALQEEQSKLKDRFIEDQITLVFLTSGMCEIAQKIRGELPGVKLVLLTSLPLPDALAEGIVVMSKTQFPPHPEAAEVILG